MQEMTSPKRAPRRMILATLDTGALIAMEKQKPRGLMQLRAAREHRAQLHAITPVVTEWWRGRTDVRERIATAVSLVPFPVAAATAAGVALANMRGEARLAVDVMVMACAATSVARWSTRAMSTTCLRSRRTFQTVRVLAV